MSRKLTALAVQNSAGTGSADRLSAAKLLDMANIKNDLYDCANSSAPSAMQSLSSAMIQQGDDNSWGAVSDPNFINNFVAKAEYYRDKIKSSFQGQELEDQLQQFDGVVNEVANKLAQNFAQYVGDFFNGNMTWHCTGNQVYTEAVQAAYGQNFDVAAFRQNIVQTINEQQKAFATIKQQYANEWQNVLDSGGSHIEDFAQRLEAVGSAAGASSADLEHMSYNDMKIVAGAIKAIHQEMGSTTNSEAIMSADLGMAQAKAELFLQFTKGSEEMKQMVRDAVNKNIGVKRTAFYLDQLVGQLFWAGHGFGGKSFDEIKQQYDELFRKTIKKIKTTSPSPLFQAFADLKNCTAENLLRVFMGNLDKLKAELTKPTPKVPGVSSGEYVSPENKLRFALSVAGQQAEDWNSFIDTLAIDPALKRQYYVATSTRTVVDVSV